MSSLLRSLHRQLPAGTQDRASRVWLFVRGFNLWLATLVGYVPSHRLRLFYYRTACRMRIGRRSTIHWQARFFAPAGITIGDNTLIGNNAFLDGRCGISIGHCVQTASEVAIYTLQHDIDDPWFGAVGAPVIIEDYVYLGPRVIVLPGVRIGRGAVVAAGAVVTKDVAPFTMVAGVPAKFVRERSRDLRYRPDFRMPFQ